MENKPFKLIPVGKNYLWGGSRLNEEFNKGIEMFPLAESWECSVHPEGLSIIGSGEYKGKTLKELLGEKPEFLGKRSNELDLPILVKLIDAREKLSIQVHPDDKYAYEHENGAKGKIEMWYVLEADEGAEIIYGLNNSVSASEIQKSIKDGSVLKLLQRVKVSKGDVFYIEPGTIHAIGAGCLIAEIQENSNLTYRLYDYNRLDNKGNKRTLHIDKALDVADLNRAKAPRQPLRVLKYAKGMASEFLCRCQYFEVYRMLVNSVEGINYRADEISYRVLLCIEGQGRLFFENEEISYHKGDCIFIPAESVDILIYGQAQFLDVRG